MRNTRRHNFLEKCNRISFNFKVGEFYLSLWYTYQYSVHVMLSFLFVTGWFNILKFWMKLWNINFHFRCFETKLIYLSLNWENYIYNWFIKTYSLRIAYKFIEFLDCYQSYEKVDNKSIMWFVYALGLQICISLQCQLTAQ